MRSQPWSSVFSLALWAKGRVFASKVCVSTSGVCARLFPHPAAFHAHLSIVFIYNLFCFVLFFSLHPCCSTSGVLSGEGIIFFLLFCFFFSPPTSLHGIQAQALPSLRGHYLPPSLLLLLLSVDCRCLFRGEKTENPCAN